MNAAMVNLWAKESKIGRVTGVNEGKLMILSIENPAEIVWSCGFVTLH